MLKTLRITCPEHDLWFLSDYHQGHAKDFILNPRGFTTVEDHDATLRQRWNARLNDSTSVIFHLGDLMMKADEARFWTFCRTHRFKHLYVLWGNHPSGQNAAYKTLMRARFPDSLVADELLYEVYPFTHDIDGTGRLVTFLPTFVELSVNGHRITLCHYPLASHHKQGHGSLMLAGHCHGNLAFTHKDTGKGRRLDVGVESFGGPINLPEIRRHLQSRELDVQDHHGREEAL